MAKFIFRVRQVQLHYINEVVLVYSNREDVFFIGLEWFMIINCHLLNRNLICLECFIGFSFKDVLLERTCRDRYSHHDLW